MRHPNSLDLEAYACGEPDERVERHVEACAACGGFVERARALLERGPEIVVAQPTHVPAAEPRRSASIRPAESPPPARITPARAAEAPPPARLTPARAAAGRRWIVVTSTLAVPLAAAAALLLLVESPSSPHVLSPGAPALDVPTTAARAPSGVAPSTTFKGSAQVAVVRDRGGEQDRLFDDVRVKPGDRLRVEIGLDRDQTLTAAVLGDDGSWLELMSDAELGPGTHFSERAARIDASPLDGTLLVGAPDAVARARATGALDGVTSIRIRWEAP